MSVVIDDILECITVELQKKVRPFYVILLNFQFYELGILKLPDTIKLRISVVKYKAQNKMLPYNRQECFAFNHDTMHLTRHSKTKLST